MTTKIRLATIVVTVLVAAVAVGLYFYREARRPKRVWVTYSERYRHADPGLKDHESKDAQDKLFAEQRLGYKIRGNQGCIVLTHDRSKADYIVSISVVRFVGGGERYGEASLSITKGNGDVVVVDRFWQGSGLFQSRRSEDIAQQPVSATWEVLCEKTLSRKQD